MTLAIEGITKTFGSFTAVNNVSFQVQPGTIFGFLGTNGAGKTTTLRISLGLTHADSGRVQAFGLSMPEQAQAIKAQMGVVSQFDTLDPDKADAVRGAYLNGLSYLDLAARHAVPLNTMRTWLRRSLLKLKECLDA